MANLNNEFVKLTNFLQVKLLLFMQISENPFEVRSKGLG